MTDLDRLLKSIKDEVGQIHFDNIMRNDETKIKQIQEKIEKGKLFDKINKTEGRVIIVPEKDYIENKALTEQVKQLQEELSTLQHKTMNFRIVKQGLILSLDESIEYHSNLKSERDELKSKIENITKDKELYKTVVLHLQKEIFDIETQGWKKSEIAEEILKTLHKILNSTKSTDSTEILGENQDE